MADERMTKGERDELVRAVKLQGRAARSELAYIKAARVADAEEQLAQTFKLQDERWRAEVQKAVHAIDEVNATINRELEAKGVPQEFRPYVVSRLMYMDRGENIDKDRRTELRRVVATRAEAEFRKATIQIDQWEAAACIDITAHGLLTAAAQNWLARLPSSETLLPRLDIESDVRRLLGRAEAAGAE